MTMPKFLIAGGGTLYAKLLDSFPPTAYTLIYVDSMAETMAKANSASLIVIAADLTGDAVTLCRNLRTDPATSSIPLILIIENKNDHVQSITDARVLRSDFKTIVKTMRNLYHEKSGQYPAVTPHDDGAHEFDERQSTNEWLSIKSATQDSERWPPPPPTQASGQDLVDFVKNFAGYMNALIASLKNPGMQSTIRVEAAASQTLEMVEALLDEIQIAMNESLMAKDLERMKVLSTAKNSIYDKLQLTRSLFNELAKKSSERETQENIQEDSLPEGPARPAQGGAPLEEKKSALTRAAEEKAAQKGVTRPTRVPQPSGTHFSLGSAKKSASSDFSNRFWICFAAVAIISAIIVIGSSMRKKSHEPAPKTSNAPPTMIYAHLEQTAAGIVIRPQAKDKERSRISFAITWLINGKIKREIKSARLQPKYFKIGDKIQVVVVPDDGTSKGAPMHSEVLIVKKRPRTKKMARPIRTPKTGS